jgi:hypothetical protein
MNSFCHLDRSAFMKTIGCASFVLACVFALQQDALGQRTRKRNDPQRPASTQPATKQAPAPPMPVLPDIRNDPDVKAADVAIIANITMEELRFDVVPDPKVDFLGKDKTTTVWHTDRYNLPDEVKPGVTYRNVGIRLKITSTLADIDRIVAEALGEVPINDGAKPTTVTTPGPAKPATTPDAKKSDQKPDDKKPDE